MSLQRASSESFSGLADDAWYDVEPSKENIVKLSCTENPTNGTRHQAGDSNYLTESKEDSSDRIRNNTAASIHVKGDAVDSNNHGFGEAIKASKVFFCCVDRMSCCGECNDNQCSGADVSSDIVCNETTVKPSSRSTFLDLPPALIAEVFKHLDARDLSVVSCVCSLFRGLSSDSHGWKNFYCERWGIPASSPLKDSQLTESVTSWRDLYVARETRSKAFLGKFQTDMMNGHTKAVRCVRILPPANLIFTAGYDSIIRVWDLEECLPVNWSRPLGFTLRAIAVDMKLLVVGGTDLNIRVWKAVSGLPHIFDVAGVLPQANEVVLSGHDGPITCVGLDDARICSGSWDMTVRIWDRNSFVCIRTLNHGDWVWAAVLRNQKLVSSAGSDVYSWDVETGTCMRLRADAHNGQAYAVECTRSGHFVFSGGEDGIIRMYDDKARRSAAKSSGSEAGPNNELVAYWHPHSGAVHALAFEDPWLVSASGDGSLSMMDVRKILKRTVNSTRVTEVFVGGKSKARRNTCVIVPTDADPPQRKLFGTNQRFYSVDIGADRIVSAGEEHMVRVWDFSRALEMERRAQASRTVRLEQRVKRKQVLHQQRDKQNNDVCNIVAKRDAVMQGTSVWQRRGVKLKA